MLAISEAPDGRVVNRDAWKSFATLGIVCSGLVGTLEIDVVNFGTTTEVVAWQTAAIIAPGAVWSVPVPCGGPYAYRIRDTANPGVVVTSTRQFWVGAVFCYLGQSNASNMWELSSSPPAVNSAVRIYRSGAWSSPNGNGIVELGNQLRAVLGVPVGFICSAIGGTSLLSYTSQSGLGYWLDTASGSPFAQFQSAFANCWSQSAEAMIFDQGEQDATDGHGYLYACGVQEFFKRYRKSSGNGSAFDNKMFLVVLGNYAGQAADNISLIRRAHLLVDEHAPDATVACCRHDLTGSDGVHTGPVANYEVQARRIAQAVAYRYGLDPKAATGPKIVSAEKSGTTVTLTVEHAAGATALAQASTGIPSGFRFGSDSNFTSMLTPTGFSIGPTSMQFTFGSAPTVMDYGYGNISADAHIVTDDVFPRGDAKGCPLQPTTNPITII